MKKLLILLYLTFIIPTITNASQLTKKEKKAAAAAEKAAQELQRKKEAPPPLTTVTVVAKEVGATEACPTSPPKGRLSSASLEKDGTTSQPGSPHVRSAPVSPTKKRDSSAANFTVEAGDDDHHTPSGSRKASPTRAFAGDLKSEPPSPTKPSLPKSSSTDFVLAEAEQEPATKREQTVWDRIWQGCATTWDESTIFERVATATGAANHLTILMHADGHHQAPNFLKRLGEKKSTSPGSWMTQGLRQALDMQGPSKVGHVFRLVQLMEQENLTADVNHAIQQEAYACLDQSRRDMALVMTNLPKNLRVGDGTLSPRTQLHMTDVEEIAKQRTPQVPMAERSAFAAGILKKIGEGPPKGPSEV